jgi:hypothetical protein
MDLYGYPLPASSFTASQRTRGLLIKKMKSEVKGVDYCIRLCTKHLNNNSRQRDRLLNAAISILRLLTQE